MTEKEQLIYPLTSLVAEFGGTLGLFLGFSFMAIWDGLQYVKGKLCKLIMYFFNHSIKAQNKLVE